MFVVQGFSNKKFSIGTIVGAILVILSASNTSGSSAEHTNGYFSTEKQSVSVSTLQEPKDFSKWLKSIDARDALKEPQTWNSFVAADVWIFFARDIDDLYLVPDFLREEFLEHYAPNALVSFRSFTVNSSSTPEKRLALAFYMDDLIDRHGENATCVAAVVAYSFIFDVAVSEVEKTLESCS